MKNRISKDGSYYSRENNKGSDPIKNKKFMMMQTKKKNMKRLGGGGLSLDSFVNAKTKNDNYNPAFIKKQREFYKNAKYVRKYKKSLQHQPGQDDSSLATRPLQDENENGEAGKMNQTHKKNQKNSSRSLNELFEKKQVEDEKARIEREAINRTKEEERERALSRRKVLREKMLKKTKFGQPVMKHRIELLLETLQGSAT
ncbi:unnamed protein product [Ilex paraguariensis]|uniref:rRNA-processing protein FYV7 n=1 Tax=Ilex paraguariensis TaxID=185542 RepID=A0ABC8U767_9AQUA